MVVAAGKFKAHCLELMRDVETTRREVVITKRGKPVAKLVPMDRAPRRRVLGCMKGTVTILGDIVAPTGEKWEANEA